MLAGQAVAGPPYLTDDPQPTDEGHWEIYNFATGSHDRSGLDGEAGLDLNYGGAKDLQLTAVLPLAFDNPEGSSGEGFRAGGGVIELAVKSKIVHADDESWVPDVSVFPRVFVPTDHRFGTGHVSLFLPVWAEKDFGPWQVFGGGGYQINPGADQRNFWQGGIAANRTISKSLQLGAEVYGQTRDTVDGPGYVALNFAATIKVTEHWSILASAGPSWEQGGADGQVFYLALKADY
ncbi:hypothetical protein [Phenylobacterium sp.]|uniref:hypothetical protein n=1 Tax=Phenylobacterium sp. TaxID=1871053 RepID=UPI001208BFEA|nr:hypothetical protein [Phenylobacterium sp.]THD58179.1 MAG: hypothetical protein E8A12_12730 [Phenylobacterium sp.]